MYCAATVMHSCLLIVVYRCLTLYRKRDNPKENVCNSKSIGNDTPLSIELHAAGRSQLIQTDNTK